MKGIHHSINRLYKTDSPRLLAVLTRLFGPHNYALAEDVLHDAFDKALTHWQREGAPPNPSAWLMQTAKNRAIDVIRASKTKTKFSEDLTQRLESEWSLGSTVEHEFHESNIKDDQLRTIFMCCHEDIKPENRIPFILKTLCGFSIPATANALIIPESTVKKRLLRTREKLKTHQFEFPPPNKIMHVMDTVHTVLYLLFNEGFHSSDESKSINQLFCLEAVGLAQLLIDEPRIVNRETVALLALMNFHMARLASRVDDDNMNIPMDLQDRKRWDRTMITRANRLLTLSQKTIPGASSRFYIEANIAKEHCNAETFADTNWDAIIRWYEQLFHVTGSPLAQLNQAIAIAYAGDIELATHQVTTLLEHKVLKNSHIPLATLAHLYAKAGDRKQALFFAESAKKRGGTQSEQQRMMQQIERLLSSPL